MESLHARVVTTYGEMYFASTCHTVEVEALGSNEPIVGKGSVSPNTHPMDSLDNNAERRTPWVQLTPGLTVAWMLVADLPFFLRIEVEQAIADHIAEFLTVREHLSRCLNL